MLHVTNCKLSTENCYFTREPQGEGGREGERASVAERQIKEEEKKGKEERQGGGKKARKQ